MDAARCCSLGKNVQDENFAACYAGTDGLLCWKQ